MDKRWKKKEKNLFIQLIIIYELERVDHRSLC